LKLELTIIAHHQRYNYFQAPNNTPIASFEPNGYSSMQLACRKAWIIR
jgi:hypothetical protein